MGEFVPGRLSEGVRLAGTVSKDDRRRFREGYAHAPVGDSSVGQLVKIALGRYKVGCDVNLGHVAQLPGDLCPAHDQVAVNALGKRSIGLLKVKPNTAIVKDEPTGIRSRGRGNEHEGGKKEKRAPTFPCPDT